MFTVKVLLFLENHFLHLAKVLLQVGLVLRHMFLVDHGVPLRRAPLFLRPQLSQVNKVSENMVKSTVLLTSRYLLVCWLLRHGRMVDFAKELLKKVR